MSENEYREIKCPNCKKLLCKANGDVEIKCTRPHCKAIVRYDYKNDKYSVHSEKDRNYSSVTTNRQTSSGITFQ